ncbi:hypothetical protein BDV37DRAFT_291803 [Aspergillus pseudonomiae]|uniref:LDB19 N-terminal domain-containing protein n=1 Tax=Aspergillus pseudonomiae TaxID=1506151 RepID=A0A5N7DK38_9EURO|nr:uncharacterized protein BDV37DRAFT_291803 [Aspergillus pseudonomiae]KAE8406655.1 hypothetical protein BDV37DRAFT_291803 [Aspergillus pseudonomiae]
MPGTQRIHDGYQCADGVVKPGELQLDAPSTHHITLLSRNEVYSPQLSGSVLVPISSPRFDQPECPDITLTLDQVLTTRTRDSMAIGKKNVHLFKRLSRRRLAPNRVNAAHEFRGCSDVETVMKCILEGSPTVSTADQHGGMRLLRFQFLIPIPAREVSYTLTATATWPSGTSTSTTRPIQIARCVLPGPGYGVSHVRNYHGATLSTELAARLTYSANLVARRTITPGDRPMEMKYVVIKELRWWVEETDTTTCEKQCVRQVGRGTQKGRWTANTDGEIEIVFGITIPRSAEAVDSLDISSYRVSSAPVLPNQATSESLRPYMLSTKKRAITVSHQLKLEIITGEDTHHQKTRSLLDRKRLWKSFKAFYPLLLHEVTTGEDLPEGLLHENPSLPQYEDGSAMPPTYDVSS